MSKECPKRRFETLDLNQLPLLTDRPKKLINASEAILHTKNSKQIYREYETDKWATVFERIEKKRFSVDDVDAMQFSGTQDIPFSLGDTLYVAPPLATRVELASLLADKILELRQFGDPIVELGAGTGSIIVRLTKDQRFADATFHAGDFSPSSLKIISYLANVEGVKISTEIYDFDSAQATFSAPPNSIILTSFSIAYMQKLEWPFWERLMQLTPRAILVAEPIYQYFSEQTLLGLLRKRYYEMNGYNSNILPSIQQASRAGILRIGDIQENVIGINPLCPVSMITIHPSKQNNPLWLPDE